MLCAIFFKELHCLYKYAGTSSVFHFVVVFPSFGLFLLCHIVPGSRLGSRGGRDIASAGARRCCCRWKAVLLEWSFLNVCLLSVVRLVAFFNADFKATSLTNGFAVYVCEDDRFNSRGGRPTRWLLICCRWAESGGKTPGKFSKEGCGFRRAAFALKAGKVGCTTFFPPRAAWIKVSKAVVEAVWFVVLLQLLVWSSGTTGRWVLLFNDVIFILSTLSLSLRRSSSSFTQTTVSVNTLEQAFMVLYFCAAVSTLWKFVRKASRSLARGGTDFQGRTNAPNLQTSVSNSSKKVTRIYPRAAFAVYYWYAIWRLGDFTCLRSLPSFGYSYSFAPFVLSQNFSFLTQYIFHKLLRGHHCWLFWRILVSNVDWKFKSLWRMCWKFALL